MTGLELWTSGVGSDRYNQISHNHCPNSIAKLRYARICFWQLELILQTHFSANLLYTHFRALLLVEILEQPMRMLKNERSVDLC